MMLKLILIVSAILIISSSFGQYYTVNDKEGFVNLRETPELKGKIIEKVADKTIVYATIDDQAPDLKSDWLHVEFYIKNAKRKINQSEYVPDVMKGFSIQSGYIHKTKLISIEDLKPMKNIQQENSYTCFNDSILIKVEIAPFIKSKHSLQFSKENEDIVDKIDHMPIIGTDGSIPHDEIKKIVATLNNTNIKIPSLSYKNLFNPALINNAYVDSAGTIYLVMYNSDAAGSYSAIFVFRKGVFVERLIFEGEC